MDDRVSITVEVAGADFAALAEIAAERDQSLVEFAAETLRAQVEWQRAHAAAIAEGLRDIDEHGTISHEAHLAGVAERRRRWFAQRGA